MADPARSLTDPPSTDPPATSAAPALRLLAWALHLSVAALLVLGCLRLVLRPGVGGWQVSIGLALALTFALLYSVGLLRRRSDVARARWWLGLVTLSWVALLGFGFEFAWLAFPLFFVHLHVLGRRHAWFAIALMTAVVILTGIWHGGGFSVGLLLGPLFGAVFSVLVALGYQALHDESEARQRALAELRRTREELARSQREAGRLGEQERLAREIHDTLAQGLSSLVLLAREARLPEIEQIAQENLTEARRFVHELAPAELAHGLAVALRILAERETARGCPTELRVSATPRPLPDPVQTALLRAAQASCANVRRHAHAAQTILTLDFLDDGVTLDVFDDGIGFDPQQVDSASFGLRGMRGRIEQLGGSVAIESTPGAGTVIGLRVPLPADEESR